MMTLCKTCSVALVALLAILLVLSDSPGEIYRTIHVTVSSFIKGDKDRADLLPLAIKLRATQRLLGKKCFVTGTSRGLGKAIAVDLLAHGCDTILAQRGGDLAYVQQLERAAREIICGSSSSVTSLSSSCVVGSGTLVPLDLSDLKSVDAVISEISHPLDVVILNAAVIPMETTLSSQGFELSFAVNYLGHYYLTSLLRSHSLFTKVSPHGSRPKLIVITSEMHKMATELTTEEIGHVKEFGMSGSLERYAHSKICLTTSTVQMAQQDHEVLEVLLYDPGPVATDIARNAPAWAKVVVDKMMQLTFKTAEESAIPVGYLAASPRSFPDAHYMLYWSNATVSPMAVNTTLQRLLEEKTRFLLAPFRK
tara:strand:- start:1837 stop:2934 length:1098 start_codon:yes stop_codon:yes gene_type:complete